MFKRIILEDWANLVPLVSFVCLFTVFVGATIWALLKAKPEADRLANLPIDGDEPEENDQ